MNYLSDQEIFLSHKSVTCPSKEDDTNRSIVLETYVQRHCAKIDTYKVHRQHCACETVASIYAAIETQRRIFRQVLKYSFGDPTNGLKYGEHQFEDIQRYVLNMDMSVEQYLEMGVTGQTFKSASGLVVKSNISIVGPRGQFLAGTLEASVSVRSAGFDPSLNVKMQYSVHLVQGYDSSFGWRRSWVQFPKWTNLFKPKKPGGNKGPRLQAGLPSGANSSLLAV